MEYAEHSNGWHCPLVTWVCGFTIEDSAHLDGLLRREERQLPAQPHTVSSTILLLGKATSLQPQLLTQGLLGTYLLHGHRARCSEQAGVVTARTELAIKCKATDILALQYRVRRAKWGRGDRGCYRDAGGSRRRTFSPDSGVGKHPE